MKEKIKIDTEDFKALQKRFEQREKEREAAMNKSRSLISASKKAILALHNENIQEAEKIIKDLNKNLSEIKKDLPEELKYSSLFPVAQQETVEATTYFYLLKEKRLPTHKELKVGEKEYLLGLCDLVGELVRKAYSYAMEDETERVMKLRDFVDNLYNQLLMFDLRDSELRRKSDSIKYNLEKLNDLAFNLKTKIKIIKKEKAK